MVINVNLTPEEFQALYKTSALTGRSVDEIVHGAILKEIEEQILCEGSPSKDEKQGKQRVYKLGVDPYAPVFDESDWEMLTNT